jgi:hypothetical protein
MIEDMTARRFKEKVQKDYVRHVRTFSEFLGRSPDTATSGGPSPLSTAHGPATNRRADHHRRHRRVAVFLHRDARTA